MSAWLEHVERWKNCTKCPLCRQRDRICLARGTIPCDVLFIGEAPGASEDATGLVFDGPAGMLLDSRDPKRPGIIQRAFEPWRVPGVEPLWYALCNLVACFPGEAKARGENEPAREEILACRPRLREFINVAQPKLIVCVGVLATEYVDHCDTVKCVDVVHPAAILRMPLAQKQMAVQKTVVVIRNAVERVLANPVPFREFGKNADLTQGRGLKQRLDNWLAEHNADLDIPF